MPIIRRNNCVYATLGTCFSVWMSVSYSHSCPKHVEIDKYTKNKYTKNKYTKKNLCTNLLSFAKKKTHILCSMPFFESHTVYEIMWRSIVQPDRPQTTIWYMRIACWIPKTTNPHSEYLILNAFTLQQWLHDAPWCYIIPTMPVVLVITWTVFL